MNVPLLSTIVVVRVGGSFLIPPSLPLPQIAFCFVLNTVFRYDIRFISCLGYLVSSVVFSSFCYPTSLSVLPLPNPLSTCLK